MRNISQAISLTPALDSRETIDVAVAQFTAAIIDAATLCEPYIRPKNTQKPPDYIVDAIAKKRRLRRRYQASRDPTDKTTFYKACHHLRDLLRDNLDDTWRKKIRKNST